MKKAEVIKLPLLSIQEAIGSPRVSALLEQGYSISAVIPVDDDGSPTLFLIMQPDRSPFSKAFVLGAVTAPALIVVASILLGFFQQ